MRVIDADRLKADYKSKIVINLIDPRRGIDLSHYAEDFCINFNKLVDNQPTVDVLNKIRAEIEQNAYPIVHGVNNHEKGMTLYGILQIIDKYKS